MTFGHAPRPWRAGLSAHVSATAGRPGATIWRENAVVRSRLSVSSADPLPCTAASRLAARPGHAAGPPHPQHDREGIAVGQRARRGHGRRWDRRVPQPGEQPVHPRRDRTPAGQCATSRPRLLAQRHETGKSSIGIAELVRIPRHEPVRVRDRVNDTVKDHRPHPAAGTCSRRLPDETSPRRPP